MSNPQADLYQTLFSTAHTWLDQTFADVTAEQAVWKPTGKVVPAGAHYAHHLTGEDFFVHQLFQGVAPLMASSHAGKIGTSEPPPQGDWSEWARTVQIDLPALRSYAQAVYADTDAFLSGLDADSLNREIDLSAMGMGLMKLSELLNIILLDTAMHCGEISAVKGLQGLKGYPF